MTRHLRFIPALAAALLMPLGALAADAPTPDAQSKAEAQVETKADAKAAKTARAQKAKAKETECEATASRIQRNKAGECWKSTQPSRTITKDELDSTGETDVGEALKRLDPRFH